jgi:invasion protein IalB
MRVILWRSLLAGGFVALISTVLMSEVAYSGPTAGETFGDWVFECRAVAENQTSCALTQTLISAQTQQAVAKFSFTRSQETSTLTLLTLLPLGLDLSAGVQGRVDGKDAMEYKLETCVAAGCFARSLISAEVLEAMKAGTALGVSFTVKGYTEPMTLTGSLKGFTEGMNATGLSD